MFFVGLMYSFALAAFINFFLMKARLVATEAILKKLKVYEEAKQKGESVEPKALKVVFLHPDLGIGGAERLVVDAALSLLRHQTRCPCEVHIVTCHHDKARAFPETVDGTIPVTVFGDFLPRSIFGHFLVLCATLRMTYAAYRLCYTMSETDIVVVDQVPAAMRMLNFVAPYTPRVFYCHFPDQLCDGRRNAAGEYEAGKKLPLPVKLYREIFDGLERSSMGVASKIYSNSNFSRQVTLGVFPELAEKLPAEDSVLPPPVPARSASPLAQGEKDRAAVQALQEKIADRTLFVSINRYERKKNIELAIEAFCVAKQRWKTDGEAPHPSPPLLVIAGGFDERVEENVGYEAELKKLVAAKQGPTSNDTTTTTTTADTVSSSFPAAAAVLEEGDVIFLRNISNGEKVALFEAMTALLYTPTQEHFGIVPLEAMQHRRPVVAVNQGGPVESVGEGEEAGGMLVAPEPVAFAEAMLQLAKDATLRDRLGAAGAHRVEQHFSLSGFANRLIDDMLALRLLSLVEAALREKGESDTKKANKEEEEKKKAE